MALSSLKKKKEKKSCHTTWHVVLSSSTRDCTPSPLHPPLHWLQVVLTIGLPGKSLYCSYNQPQGLADGQLLLLLLSHFSPTLCDPIEGSPSGFPIPGILQARILEWVAISSSTAWKWKVKVKSLGHVRLVATPWTAAHQAPLSMGFSRQECWSGVPLPSLDGQLLELISWLQGVCSRPAVLSRWLRCISSDTTQTQ